VAEEGIYRLRPGKREAVVIPLINDRDKINVMVNPAMPAALQAPVSVILPQ